MKKLLSTCKVFPVKPNSKMPAVKRFNDPTYLGLSPNSIISWLKNKGNIALIIPKDMLVLDFDPREHPSAILKESFDKLLSWLGFKTTKELLQHHLVVKTGAKRTGYHIYFRLAKEEALSHFTCGKVKGLVGFQLLTPNKWLTLPPSVHPDGGEYCIISKHTEPQYAPAYLIPHLVSTDLPEHLDREVPLTSITPEVLAEHILVLLDPTDFRNRDDWLRLLFACHYVTGGTALEEFTKWSMQDALYDKPSTRVEIEASWNSSSLERKTKSTGGTLVYYVALHHPKEAIEVKRLLFPELKDAEFALLSQRLAQAVLERHLAQGTRLIYDSGDEMHAYLDGYWQRVKTAYLNHLCFKELPWLRDAFDEANKVEDKRLFVNTVPIIQATCYTSENPILDLTREQNIINLRNGEIVFDEDNTQASFRPHRADSYQTSIADLVYDEEAICPLFDRTLLSMFSDHVDPR